MPIPRIGRCIVSVLAATLVSFFPGSMIGQPAAQPVQQGSGNDSFEALAKQATAAREEGKTHEAIHFYEGALQQNPDWTDGLWYLGILYADAGRYNYAIPAFQKVTTVYPKLGPAWAYLGLCEFETKDFDKFVSAICKMRSSSDSPKLPGVEKLQPITWRCCST